MESKASNVPTQATCLEPYLPAFEDRLKRRDYAPATITFYRRLIHRLGASMEARGITVEQLTSELAAELVRGEEHRASEPNKCRNIARRFVDHLIEVGVVAAPVLGPRELARAELQRNYEHYLRQQRGLSERSIYHAWRLADRFVSYRFGADDVDLGALQPCDAAAFLQQLSTRPGSFRDKTPPTHLRTFLQFLFREGVTPTNLATCVPRVAQRYGARLPRHLTPDQVEAVLAAVRAEPGAGRRDHAMVLLLARLGLRASEVVTIELDDIDWRAGELTVRGKGGRHDRVPIPADVGAALVEYIRHDRRSTSRSLFVTVRAPHRPFKDGQVLNALLRRAFVRAGVKPPTPYVGSHVLRHSLATNLVRQGASLAEVGDMLRHRSRASTLIYAKLDIEGLRSIAQPWPAPGGER